LVESVDFTVSFIRRERSSPDRLSEIFLWRFFGLGSWRDVRVPRSAGFENQSPIVDQEDFWYLPEGILK